MQTAQTTTPKLDVDHSRIIPEQSTKIRRKREKGGFCLRVKIAQPKNEVRRFIEVGLGTKEPDQAIETGSIVMRALTRAGYCLGHVVEPIQPSQDLDQLNLLAKRNEQLKKVVDLVSELIEPGKSVTERTAAIHKIKSQLKEID